MSDATDRVRQAAARAGLTIDVMEMPGSTRTAEDAANACGCSAAEIVKSLVFVGAASGSPYLLLVSGANRVDTAGMADLLGEALERPDATRVRALTGFAIGGIPPFGHDTPAVTWIDEDLLRLARVWAAAGTPRSVFAVDPQALRQATGAHPFQALRPGD